MWKYFFILAVLVIGVILVKYGRSIYAPLEHRIKGKETIDTVITRVESDVWNRLKENLKRIGYETDYPEKIVLVAFKEERRLEVYAENSNGRQLIKTYPFTAFSGTLGPKLKEGDKQIPEGIYHIEYLNPNSAYYLSIKVSYPNEFDKMKSQLPSEKDMGGDIFIHGKAATIGCIPIGDQAIEEVFLLTQKAMHHEVKVIISPRDFRTTPDYPEIEWIDWEEELYDLIAEELKQLP